MFFRHLLYFVIGYVSLQYAGHLMPDILFYHKLTGGGYYSVAQSLNDFFLLLIYRPIPVFLSLFFYLLGVLFIRYVILKRMFVWKYQAKGYFSYFIQLLFICLGGSILWLHYGDPIARIIIILVACFELYRFIVYLTVRGKNYNSYGI